MELIKFLESFQVTSDVGNENVELLPHKVDSDFVTVIKLLGGKTFNNGLYRVFKGDQLAEAIISMERAFPEFAGRIAIFGYDWLGRHFAIDFGRVNEGQPQVLMLEIGAGEAMQIPTSILDFHNSELVNHADDALSAKFFKEWQGNNSASISPNECVGYKVPLFLGGVDDISNLEIIDLSVYVQICSQLRNKTKTLASGQTIRQIAIKD